MEIELYHIFDISRYKGGQLRTKTNISDKNYVLEYVFGQWWDNISSIDSWVDLVDEISDEKWEEMADLSREQEKEEIKKIFLNLPDDTLQKILDNWEEWYYDDFDNGEKPEIYKTTLKDGKLIETYPKAADVKEWLKTK